MNKITLISLLVCLSLINTVENASVPLFQLSASAIDANWAQFKKNFGRSFSSKTIEAAKRVNFEQNLAIINANNEKYNRGEVGHLYGVNKFTDYVKICLVTKFL